ncbi:glutaredoxin family protein [[Eubacterium] cellulosolvens]
MKTIKIPGKNRKHKVLMYTLSTCGWCKMTKNYFKEKDIECEYVDVDQCSEEEYKVVRQDILNRGGNLSFPTIIIDDKILITGFQKDKIKKALT